MPSPAILTPELVRFVTSHLSIHVAACDGGGQATLVRGLGCRADPATAGGLRLLVARPQAEPVLNGEQIVEAQHLVRRVAVAEHVQDYAIRLVLATHPQGEFAADITNQYVRFGASPRGVQSLILAAKVRAMLDERYHISFSDVRASCLAALRHRILLNFEAQAEGVSNDDILTQILNDVSTSAETVSR